jgi:two-component system nitrate/nitrite response regulator NarL
VGRNGSNGYCGASTLPGGESGTLLVSGTTRVFLIAGTCVHRDGLSAILAGKGLELVGAAIGAADGVAAIRALETAPDVVLVDVAGGKDIETARRLLDALPHLPVLAIAVPTRETELIACAQTGVGGFLAREATVEELVAGLERSARGEAVCSPGLAPALLRCLSALTHRRLTTSRLTVRELEVARLIADGLSNKQIAHRLCIELSTVKNHVHHILVKLGAPGRSAAAAHLAGYYARDLASQLMVGSNRAD